MVTVIVTVCEEDNRFYLHEVIEQKELSNKVLIPVQRQSQRPKAIASILQNIISVEESLKDVLGERYNRVGDE